MSQIRNFKLSGGASDIPATKYLDFTKTRNGLPATSQRHPSDIPATKHLDFTQTGDGLPATSQRHFGDISATFQRQNISTLHRRETVCQQHPSDIPATSQRQKYLDFPQTRSGPSATFQRHQRHFLLSSASAIKKI